MEKRIYIIRSVDAKRTLKKVGDWGAVEPKRGGGIDEGSVGRPDTLRAETR
jgi:hypothetical protein